MRKVFLIMLFFGLAPYITVAQNVVETPEVKFVRTFMNEINLTIRKDKNAMKKYIAPSYHEMIYAKYPNIFCGGTGKEYKVVRQNSDTVIVYTWSDKKSAPYEHAFKIIRENQKYYILPRKETIGSWYNCSLYSKSTYLTRREYTPLVSEYKEQKLEINETPFSGPLTLASIADYIKRDFTRRGSPMVYERKNSVLHHDGNGRLKTMKYNTAYQVLYLYEGEEDKTLTIKSLDDGYSNDFSPKRMKDIESDIQYFSVVIDTKRSVKYLVSTSPASIGYLMVFKRDDLYDNPAKRDQNRNINLSDLIRR